MKEDDSLFLRIADQHVALLEEFGFHADSAILDIGSGYGRLVYGILNRHDFRGRYVGLDVLRAQVQWCQENITQELPQFRFELIDVRNDRYNQLGRAAGDEFRFDLPAASFDFCTLFSVFTHMYEEDIRRYLAEMCRLLRTNGVVASTFFLLDDKRLERLRTRTTGLTMHHVLNDHTRYHNPADRLHAIAFDRSWMQQMIEELGLEVVRITKGHWSGDPSVYYQDHMILRKPGM